MEATCRARSGVRFAELVLVAALMALAACPRAEGKDRRAARKSPEKEAQRPVDFRSDIRPLLSDKCYRCHGPDEEHRRADLSLHEREGLFEDLGGYFPIVPGKPEESAVFLRVTAADPYDRMPPRKANKNLTPEDIEMLRRWIVEGAKWQDHWAYEPPARTPAPGVDGGVFIVNDIDRFIFQRLRREGLQPSAPADKVTMARRLFFDLNGLPPAPSAVDAFVADTSPGAYEKLVESLLARPAYGERMAIMWLDLVRYADTTGYHGDNHRDVWAYRDWVIEAFNKNMPFDRFTVEQLAGDLLPDASVKQKVASGYNRLNMTTQEGGAQPGEYVAKYAADRVRNASSVWMGATLGCAQCHDHKYDPYTSRDFYRFAAFFADIKELAIGEPGPGFPLPTKEQSAELGALEAKLRCLKEAREKGAPDAEQVGKEIAALEKRKAKLQKAIPTTMISVSVAPRTVRVLPRGNWMDTSGDVVDPGVPHFLRQIEAGRRATRLDLARWLTDSRNPLTARVFVNRLWSLFFGHGLARNVDDLGSQGAPPTHPALLDWLAVEFMESGWDVKHMVRLMVLSGSYRQTSYAAPELAARDPRNEYLARQSRWRLDAEIVRDTALTISGLLCPRIGGPSVKPPQPAGYWSHLNFPKRKYKQDHGESMYRRGLYTYWQRAFLYPSFLAFDAPTREDCTAERPRSNTPLQALVLLNDPVYVEAARALAEKILHLSGASVAERITWACRQAVSRPPSVGERRILETLHAKQLEEYRRDPAAASKLVQVGEHPRPEGVDAVRLAAWMSVARVLINLQETTTRN